MSGKTASFENIGEGQEIPPFQKKSDLAHWNRFAAANDEFVYLHMDDEFARARGEKGVLAMGNLRYSYLHVMLRDWIGDCGRIKRVSCSFRGKQYKGDTLTCRGKVKRKYLEDDQSLVDLEVWIENQQGVTISAGEATVVMPSNQV